MNDVRHLRNSFGPHAAQAIAPVLPNGLDLRIDSFSVRFWLRAPYGGGTEWASKHFRVEPDAGVEMRCSRQGGTVLSTRDVSGTASGFTLLMLPQVAYLTAGFVDADGVFHDLGGIRTPADTRWHQLALAVDRTGDFMLYVDAAPAVSLPIAQYEGVPLGMNALSLGADTLGQYGIGDAYLADPVVKAGCFSREELTADLLAGRLALLRDEIAARLLQLGSEYTPAMRDRLQTVLQDIAGKDDAAAYQQLRTAYEAFLAAPQPQARLTLALLGDPHVAASGDACSLRIGTLIADTAASGLQPDALIGVGDNGNDSTYAMGRAAFSLLADQLQKHLPACQLVACHGNHDTMYNSTEANFMEGTRAYRDGLTPFLCGPLLQPQAQVDEWYRDVAAEYLKEGEIAGSSFGMTVKGCHFLLLNTDYLPQTGCSKTAIDPETGKYPIDGNALDPIRHALHLHDGTFAWLRHTLDQYSRDGKPIFVVCHFPFVDSVPLSYFDEIVIEDNSIGRQDRQIRALLSEYDQIVYICGHLHSALGMSAPVQVHSDVTCRSFTEINISAMKPGTRGYAACPAGWHLFLYDDEIVLRARDYGAHAWLTEFDAVIPLR